MFGHLFGMGAASYPPVRHDHESVPIIRWLESGHILFGLTGQVRLAQEKVQKAEWVQPIDDAAAYGSWFAINYNFAQARRLLQSNDSLYRTTLNIRIATYGHMDIWSGYFTIRKLSWDGDDAAVKYLRAHDSPFLNVYQQFIAETDSERKMDLYEEAAAHATAPLGGLWPKNVAVMDYKKANETWQQLLS